MSRVLLFVQTGAGKPRVAHIAPDYYGPTETRQWCSDFVIRVKMNDEPHQRWRKFEKAAKYADRWWLVECENAEAGRAIITHDALRRTSIGKAFDMVPPVVKSRDPKRVSEPVYGRILAHGGSGTEGRR